MFFKKNLTKFLQNLNKTEKSVTVNNEVQVIETNPVSESSTENSAANPTNQSLLGSSILFGKLNNWFGPDFAFENEAWAPGNEYIGLFRRRRSQVEEQTPSAIEPNNQ